MLNIKVISNKLKMNTYDNFSIINFIEYQKEDIKNIKNNKYLIINVIKEDNIKLLQYFFYKKFSLSKWIIYIAIKYDSINCFKFLKYRVSLKGQYYSDYEYELATRNDSKKILCYLIISCSGKYNIDNLINIAKTFENNKCYKYLLLVKKIKFDTL